MSKTKKNEAEGEIEGEVTINGMESNNRSEKTNKKKTINCN